MNDWLSVREYAKLYAVHRQTVYKWRDDGLLTIMRVNKIMRIRNIPPATPVSGKSVSMSKRAEPAKS